jgi:GNAT superfamily N-acetyltransferase
MGRRHDFDQLSSGQIRKLMPGETVYVIEHLLRLDRVSRRQRFSHDVANGYVEQYARTVFEPGSMAFGYIDGGEIRALAELRCGAIAWGATAEAAFTVEEPFRNHGVATRLMGLIIRSARNRGIRHLKLYCLTDNPKMKAIAKHYGADLTITEGSVTADIMPRIPDYKSIATEMIEDRIAVIQSVIDFQNRVLRYGVRKAH